MTDEKEIGVYIWQNVQTKETYIGSGDLEDRHYNHLHALNKGSHFNHRFQEAYNRNPHFEFVSVPTENSAEARQFEQVLIDEHWGNPLLLNLLRTVDKVRLQHTEETRRKISQANLGNKNALGRTVSEETREKIRLSNLGQKRSPEFREKMREVAAGRTLSPERREQLRPYLEKHVEEKKTPVTIQGTAYPSILEASRQLNIPKGTIRKRVRSQTSKFEDWRYTSSDQS